jgi:hypothetical protein
MTPSEFKSRFIELLPCVPPELNLTLDEFVTFSPDRAAALHIPDSDRAFLTDSGLPAAAAPFLSFGPDSESALMPLDGFADSVMIGHNGSGDMICVDQSDGGAVVYYNHDNRMQRVFINSSLSQFARSLCAYSSLSRTKDADAFRAAMSEIDAAAIARASFWLNEMETELEG